jgi:hypothetical protein
MKHNNFVELFIESNEVPNNLAISLHNLDDVWAILKKSKCDITQKNFLVIIFKYYITKTLNFKIHDLSTRFE